MDEPLYIKFTEHNDNEGETWHFFIKLKGNKKKIFQIKNLLSSILKTDPYVEDMYNLDETPIPESEVDILVNHSPSGHYPTFNKVIKIKELPESVDFEIDDPFY